MYHEQKTIICFGDSNTHGYDSCTHGRFSITQRWTGLLETMLGKDYLVHEEGLSGRTTVFDDPLFEGLSGLSYISPCMLTHEPLDLLIIMLGTNDVKERFNATPENIAKGLERLVNKAISTTDAWRTKPNILIVTPPAIEVGYETTEVAGEMGKNCVQKSQALAPLYQEVARKFGCHYLDAGSIEGMQMYPYDYMHLSPESHQILAAKLAEFIPEII